MTPLTMLNVKQVGHPLHIPSLFDWLFKFVDTSSAVCALLFTAAHRFVYHTYTCIVYQC